jgi:hypothetical protein
MRALLENYKVIELPEYLTTGDDILEYCLINYGIPFISVK